MNTVQCYYCGGTDFTIVEFRNTRHLHVSRESVDFICPKCGLVMFMINGRLEKTQAKKPTKAPNKQFAELLTWIDKNAEPNITMFTAFGSKIPPEKIDVKKLKDKIDNIQKGMKP